ncbi:MAG TPA: hypothetical protein VIS96_13890 [Terrimicrobiaceae bacterium]
MNPPNFILVAHARTALPQALSVAEVLQPFAEVQLTSYDLSREQLPQELDAVLCIVTDEESIEMAHDFQGRLEDVPVFVVDSSGSLKIELNGYAGRVSSSPDQMLGAVRQFLAANGKRNVRMPQSETRRTPRKLSTPFNQILARTAGEGQSPQALLIASARQLSSDLRAERVEVFLHMAETNAFQKIYSAPETDRAKDPGPSPEVIRLIKRRLYPTTPDDLESRLFSPLHRYLTSKRLNLLVPLVKETRLLGWMAFRLEAALCTDDLLDDIQVAGHLLSISLADAWRFDDQSRDAKNLQSALSALGSGIAIVDPEGQIGCIAGALTFLGGDPQKGDHFKAIHNSRVREVVALGLEGRFVEKSWVDFDSQETIYSFSTKLPDGRIVVFWAPRPIQGEPAQKRGDLDLKEVLESLPVPVLLDNEVSPGTVPVPQGRITDEDGQAIRDCALQAQARKVKALRLRWGKKRSADNAVLFYYRDADEGNDEFCDDIKHAVRFSLVGA